jgi:hypothetical protein
MNKFVVDSYDKLLRRASLRIQPGWFARLFGAKGKVIYAQRTPEDYWMVYERDTGKRLEGADIPVTVVLQEWFSANNLHYPKPVESNLQKHVADTRSAEDIADGDGEIVRGRLNPTPPNEPPRISKAIISDEEAARIKHQQHMGRTVRPSPPAKPAPRTPLNKHGQPTQSTNSAAQAQASDDWLLQQAAMQNSIIHSSREHTPSRETHCAPVHHDTHRHHTSNDHHSHSHSHSHSHHDTGGSDGGSSGGGDCGGGGSSD